MSKCYSSDVLLQKGIVPPHTFPCGKCPVCLQRRRNSWAYRLEYEFRKHNCGIFLTLTYDDDHYEDTNIRAIQKFIKRLRKNPNVPKFRYYAVSEHGERTLRPHYHLLLFGLSKKKHRKHIESAWKNGFLFFGQINSKTIKYVTKYSLKRYLDNSIHKTDFQLFSRKPMIGDNYITDMKDWHLNDPDNRLYMPHPSGYKLSLYRGYRNKIYPENYRVPVVFVDISDDDYNILVSGYQFKCKEIIQKNKKQSQKI